MDYDDLKRLGYVFTAIAGIGAACFAAAFGAWVGIIAFLMCMSAAFGMFLILLSITMKESAND